MTESCKDCETATKEPHHGFKAECKGCAARAASRSMLFHRAQKQGRLDHQYRGLIAQYGVTHDEVKLAADTDFLHSKESSQPTRGKP